MAGESLWRPVAGGGLSGKLRDGSEVGGGSLWWAWRAEWRMVSVSVSDELSCRWWNSVWVPVIGRGGRACRIMWPRFDGVGLVGDA